MIDQFINFVIRPPRANYNPDQYLWEKDFTLAGRAYKRQDLKLTNARGHTLQCSHYVPSPFPEDTPLPCVINCHGNRKAMVIEKISFIGIFPCGFAYIIINGCRADANEAAVILLPSNITVFALDFSGSGLSDGEYVSLGWHERDDLKVVVSYLRSNQQILRIEDPSIAGMVLDSAFANLFDLMMELVDVYKIRLPKFIVAPKTFIPALFGHASEDKFIQSHLSDLIFMSYAGDKNMIKFDGDQNSSRPQFYYDSVSIFFFIVLYPCHSSASSSKLDKYYNLGDLKAGGGIDESLLCEIITGLCSACADAASSSSATTSIPTTKPVSELLSEIMPITSILAGKPSGQIEECCSYTSSNRESWGRCSSLGGSDEESSVKCEATDSSHEMTQKALATPLRSMQQAPNSSEEEKNKKNKALTVPKKLKSEKFERLEAFSKQLRRCFLKRVNHQRHCSS
ncbi:hypothetical protein P3X46_003965 [Hevea brasiliensis]|uniref:Serine aminopeptidase S33 domain-containing protein n=1 Tax=Hevea brasiliensis TaxID=3981 RepID=A0ABQ9MV81_HEVBR|nr:hypothetical protein P3X46_003965 [Hevea brasiliensis]